MRVSVIGLGNMGRGMAEQLSAHGFQLSVWNRSPVRTEGLAAAVRGSAAEAAREGDVVLTSLANDDAVRDVVLASGGVLEALRPDAVHAGMSTISPDLARELAARHAERGRAYVSAPVLGRPDAAATGQLYVIAGGDARAVARCRPVFETIGQRTFQLDDAPQANLAKVLVNFQLAGTLELLGEVFALAEKGGLAPASALEILSGTLLGSPAVEGYGRRIVEGRFEPAGFAMPLGLKDVRLALGLGDELNVPLPAGEVVQDHMQAALAAGLGHLDWSGLTRIVRRDAGLEASPPR
jgi:3-hydroxyisobutyrate dehydrogenase-like beta-hydroxyacid dehydrogenase